MITGVFDRLNPCHVRRFALLIEDKIDALLQPEQEARYRLRAPGEVSRGDYGEFEVILCSPEAYVSAQPKAASFDRFVSYEAISKFLRDNDSTPRGAYRAKFVATAALRSANTWVRIDDVMANVFWKAAHDLAAREFPILEMKELNVAKDTTWLSLRPQDMPTQPRPVYVLLKGDRGFMDLTFTGSTAHLFHPLIAPLLNVDMTVHEIGKSAAIRIEETAQAKVRSAFVACERLINSAPDRLGHSGLSVCPGLAV